MHWWRGPDCRNFGDELSPIVVRAMAGRAVERAPIHQADLLAIGSILQAAARSTQLTIRREPLHVWGTGIITPLDFPRLPCLSTSAVRGPLTRNVLRLRQSVPLGDPGLLADRLIEPAESKEWAWGVIPHHSQVESGFVRRILEHTPKSTLIDVRGPYPLATITKIAKCDRIASTSLHGLIVADAFKIPNIWISPQRERRGLNWKFADYFLSVGRSLFQPLSVPESADLNEIAGSEKPDYLADIDLVKECIAAAFPAL